MNTGIYKITSLIDDKFYIGSAENFPRRFRNHKYYLRLNKHHNNYLQNVFNKYGENNLNFEIIAKCPKEYLIKLEQWFIDNLKPEYNICKVANSCLGRKHSQETRDIISKKLSGRKQSDEHKEKNRLKSTGNTLPEETINKLKQITYNHLETKGSIKLNKEQVLEIIELLNKKEKIVNIAKKFNVSRHTVTNIKKGHTWYFLNVDLPKVNKSRFTITDIEQIRELIKNKTPYKIISEKYDILFSTISKIKNNLNYGM